MLLQGTGGNQNWIDGLSLWVKLLVVGVAGATSWVGYKVNTELFKRGGVMERLEEHGKEMARMKEQKGDHERRIRDLEHWRFRSRD